jgi:hypothetical protein
MERRRQFTPTVSDALEVRVVLSQTTLGLSPVVSGLAPHLQQLNRKQTALIAEVNQAFDSFQNDFDQARATYFASLQGLTSPNDSAQTAAFQAYTQQRTMLLAQQLVGSFVQTPQGTAHAPSQPNALKQLIESKIIGPKGNAPSGALYTSLKTTNTSMSSLLPAGSTPSALVSLPTTSLYTLSQDNAIQASRTAVLNGVSIIKAGAFGIQKQSHY